MTKVKSKERIGSRSVASSHNEIYKVVFGVALGVGLMIGVVAFASLGVGLFKAAVILMTGV